MLKYIISLMFLISCAGNDSLSNRKAIFDIVFKQSLAALETQITKSNLILLDEENNEVWKHDITNIFDSSGNKVSLEIPASDMLKINPKKSYHFALYILGTAKAIADFDTFHKGETDAIDSTTSYKYEEIKFGEDKTYQYDLVLGFGANKGDTFSVLPYLLITKK